MKNIKQFIIFVVGCELVGIVGSLFTFSAIPTWYASLSKPFFAPPNWIFGPVWTTLYFMMGVSAFLIWEKGLKSKKNKQALIYFCIQLFFNFLWSILFFGLQNPLLGLIDILLLLTFIILTTIKFYKISRIAAYLMLPYLLWVSFATILNLSLFILNP